MHWGEDRQGMVKRLNNGVTHVASHRSLRGESERVPLMFHTEAQHLHSRLYPLFSLKTDNSNPFCFPSSSEWRARQDRRFGLFSMNLSRFPNTTLY